LENCRAIYIIIQPKILHFLHATSKARSRISQKEIEKYFGKGKKLSAEGKKNWRRTAAYGDSSVQHDLGVYLARDGELEEAKQWWRISASNGCIASMKRLRQLEKMEESEKQKKLKKSKTKKK
jgi:hypothetical protein